MTPIRIGNAQAFWGDDGGAAERLARQSPDLDAITLDYLAEVSMSILAKQRQRDPAAGFARDFLAVVESLVPIWKSGRKLRLITNAGGLNPSGCAAACAQILNRAGCRPMKIGIVDGDDVLAMVKDRADLVTANAYLGAQPIADAIQLSAEIIITGRVADPSLTVGPCIAHFGWKPNDYDRLAGATVAGHLIECGTQVTGGISTDWLDIPDPAHIGFPIAEIFPDGSCIITKPPGTGGCVNLRTVKEQLLYEIGDPGNYLSPDATVSFLTLRVSEESRDQVSVQGATGRSPPSTYKVSATYPAGYRAVGSFAIVGQNGKTKAERCAQIVSDHLRQANMYPDKFSVDYFDGADDTVLMRVAAVDRRKEAIERFAREWLPLISAGPQGFTGYGEGRPTIHEVFAYWPTAIDRQRVHPQVRILESR